MVVFLGLRELSSCAPAKRVQTLSVKTAAMTAIRNEKRRDMEIIVIVLTGNRERGEWRLAAEAMRDLRKIYMSAMYSYFNKRHLDNRDVLDYR